MDIRALKTDWFFDDVTPRGLSFDAFLPQACKTPLGDIRDFELIHSPTKMAEFQDNIWYGKNPGLAEILMTVSPLESGEHVLVDEYKKKVADILNVPCDFYEHGHDANSLTLGACRGFEILRKDVSRYTAAAMTGDNELDEGKLYDVKKEIYRLTDRLVSGLGKCFNVQANGAFEVIDELRDKKMISSAAGDNLASASAIGLKLRISTYLNAEKQSELLKTKSNDTADETTPKYHMLQDEELFHFFFVAIPLYEELRYLFSQAKCFVGLRQVSYFDYTDANKAGIYTRVLNYPKAVECYERALKTSPGDVNMEIRLLRLQLIINDNTEPIQHKLDSLLQKIVGESCSKTNRETPNDAQLDAILSSVGFIELRQLLEILIFLSYLKPLNWHSKVAEMILNRFTTTKDANDFTVSQMLMMDLEFSEFYLPKISNWQGYDAGIIELSTLIDSEGVSTISIRSLNRMAEFYFIQGQCDRSYKCLQRALSMERALYGKSPNLNAMKTLHQLGMVSIQLFMIMEARFYLECMLQQFESFDGAMPRLMHKQAYLQLAVLCYGTNQWKEAISHLQKGLELSTDKNLPVEQNLDSLMRCEMARVWHALNNNDEAKEWVLNAKDYLPNIVRTDSRTMMTCHVAMTFHELGLCDEAVSLLKDKIQLLEVQSYPEGKAACLISLARICDQKCRAVEAENYYNEALKIITSDADKSSIDTNELEGFLEMSDVLTGNGKPLEARKRLKDAKQYVSRLCDKHEKCNMLMELGERWERFGEIYSAARCYYEALNLCTNSTLIMNIPLTEFLLELKLGDLAGKPGILGLRAKEYESHVTKEQRLAAQCKHYDRAGSLLQQYCERGNANPLLMGFFLLLAHKYVNIDVKQMEKYLLNALEISDEVYRSTGSKDTISFVLFSLFACYVLRGEFTPAADAIERLLKSEMDEHASDPFHPRICHGLVFFSWLHLIHSPTSRNTGELLVEFFRSGLNDEGFMNSSVTVKANAAHCFTFLSFIFWWYDNLTQAELLNKTGLELFKEIEGQGIPENRSSSRVACFKIKKILEEPNSQVAVLELLQFLALQLFSESDVWGYLREHNSGERVRNILESSIPSFLSAKYSDVSFFVPKFILLYDQYSDHTDVKSRPLLSFHVEILRQFSQQIYGKNPVMDGKTLNIGDLIELLPSAKNLIFSVFSSQNGTSFLDKVKEDIGGTNYRAFTLYSVEDCLTNSFNIVSSLLANVGKSGGSSVIFSLLPGSYQNAKKNNETVPPPTVKEVNVDFVEENKNSDYVSVPKTKSLKEDNNVSTPPKMEKEDISTREEDKGVVSLPALIEEKRDVKCVQVTNESHSKPPSISANSGKEVRVDFDRKCKNSASVAQPDKNHENSNLPHPTAFAVDVLKNLIGHVFGIYSNKSVTSVSLTKKGNSQKSFVADQQSEKIEPCSSDTGYYNELHVDEHSPHIETLIDNILLRRATPPSTYSEQHLTAHLEDLETFEMYSEHLKYLDQKIEGMQMICLVVEKLADSISYFSKKGEFQKCMETGDNLFSLIHSFVEIAPRNTNIEICLREAAEELKNCQTNSARNRLTIAAQFSPSERHETRIFKMRGDCYLLEGRYRLAAINFTRAAKYHSVDTTQDPDDVLGYLGALVGLAKAHLLCQKANDAWQVCQDGVAVLAQLEASESISQRKIEFCFLSAKCLFQLSKNKVIGDHLETAVSVCQQGLAARKIVDEEISSGDLLESLRSNGELFAVKYEIHLLLATILQQLNKQEEAERILTDILELLVNVGIGFETFTAATWEGGGLEFFNTSCRLFSCIGRAFLMNGKAQSATASLEKSLLAFVSHDRMDSLSLDELFIPLLDAITASKATIFPDDSSGSFQQTVDMYKQAILEKHDNVNTLYGYFLAIGLVYMKNERASEAIVLYENALMIAECLSDSLEDQGKRALIQLHLGHAHRLHFINNTGAGRDEERNLAIKYYKTGRDTDLRFSTLRKKITLACWLFDQNEFAQANGLLQELLELQDKLAEIGVAIEYFSRSFYGPIMHSYIEEHGESTTTVACLVYSLAVLIYIEMGMTHEAILVCEKLSRQPVFRGTLNAQPSVTTYQLVACQRKLSSLASDRSVQNCEFPLSSVNLARLYYELEEYELAIEHCLEILNSVESLPGEPSDVNTIKLNCVRIAGNGYIQMGNHNKCYSFFTLLLELLDRKEGILELEFDKQCGILDEYFFAERFFIFRSLGVMCARRGNTEGAMKCYEKCLEEDEYLESHQDLVGTLAELYQSKALLAQVDKSVFSYWMKLADDLYARLLQHTTKMTPFVESSYGWFLCKCDRHHEAINHFLSVIKSTEDTSAIFADEDKPLLDVNLRREIEVRGSICLPLKVFVYYQLTLAYLAIKEMGKTEELVVALENYVARWQSSTEYPLILSVLGYTYKLIGNKEKAVSVFCSVLEKTPEHPPVVEALESH